MDAPVPHVRAISPLIVLMPVYNDWDVVPALVQQLDEALSPAGLAAEIVAVDDGSTVLPEAASFAKASYRAIASISVLRLGRNMGHQRAIAVGLAHIHTQRPDADVVVMDADGEDAPSVVPRLVAAGARDPSRVVFAARAGRSEGPAFRALYRLYQLTHRLLTGTWTSLGNFSFVPRAALPRLVMLSELWNHYPGAVLKARMPISTIPADRSPRLGGHSQMNLVSLILHGLSAISVHGDVIGVRALIASLVAVALSVAGIVVVVAIRLATDLAIPGWASFLVAVLAAILLQALSLSLVFVFVILNSRNYFSAIPRRDYREYVIGEDLLYPGLRG